MDWQMFEWLYNIAMLSYERGAMLYGRYNRKARQWSEGRRNIFERLRDAIPTDERIIWVHAASLGEFEQGRPIIEELRHQHPEYKILLTFFSPSGYEIRKNYTGADYIFYLPIDRASYTKRFLDIVNPKVAIFIKYEFWLNYLTELHHRSIPTILVSAIFRRNSIFFRPWGGAWRRALGSFSTLFVQNDESRLLLRELGVENSVVAGDTRFDRVAAIARTAQQIPIVESFAKGGRLFVAGSTWAPDEELLIELINDNPSIRFIVAPHELSEERITHLAASVRGGVARYTQSSVESDFSHTQLLILDTIGILASVYGYATWAYIGGGFGVGIHNTLEATTFGLPIAFGPAYHKFQEACDLIKQGAARSINSAAELKAWFIPLRDNELVREKASRSAREYTEQHCGATQKIMDKLSDLL